MERKHEEFHQSKSSYLVLRINTFLCFYVYMRTTLDLPDELATEIKILAAQERRTLKELIGELLRGGLRARQVPVRGTTLPPVHQSRRRMNQDWLSGIRREGGR